MQAAKLRPEIYNWTLPQTTAPELITQAPYTVQEFMSLLDRAMSLFDRFYLFVDALNETPWQLELQAALSNLLHARPNVRLLVTSTTPPNIDAESNSVMTIQYMAAPNVDQDIAEYVIYRLRTEPAFYLSPKTLETPSSQQSRRIVIECESTVSTLSSSLMILQLGSVGLNLQWTICQTFAPVEPSKKPLPVCR